jgi:hypothetical protein
MCSKVTFTHESHKTTPKRLDKICPSAATAAPEDRVKAKAGDIQYVHLSYCFQYTVYTKGA